MSIAVPSTPAERFAAAIDFAGRFFMADSPVHRALTRICAILDREEIPYALAGAMAMNAHGYERVTKDIDLLMTPEGLAAFKKQNLGLGYLERFAGSKGFRDTEQNVPIDVLMSGEYPGDGKPKPVRFPDPSVATRIGEMNVLPIEKLVELKLASGLSAEHRGKDLVDVQELVRYAKLPLELADSLDASVRDEYRKRWQLAQASMRDDY
ncbi:MAG: hypothetical protein U1F43_23120 [Myxococcota bacterium]